MGAYPLRAFLKEVLSHGRPNSDSPTVFDADTWDISGSVVVTEWRRIDLLIRNDEERFVVVVENKVDSGEHNEQLARYRGIIDSAFRDYTKAFVYLTPAGDPPSDEAYLPLDYSTVADLVSRTVDRKRLQLSDEVRTFLEQYAELVRRHIVEDSEIQELCRRLYEKHRIAFDLVYEHRPDRALEVSQALRDALAAQPGLVPEHTSKAYVRFSTPILDRFPRIAEGWTKSGRLVLFEFENYNEKVVLRLVLGPGPEAARSLFREHVSEQDDVFNRAKKKSGVKWWCFHRLSWLSKKPYVELPQEELAAHLSEKLTNFVERDLPALEGVLGSVAEVVADAFPESD